MPVTFLPDAAVLPCDNVGALEEASRVGLARSTIGSKAFRFRMLKIAVEQILESIDDSPLAIVQRPEIGREFVCLPVVRIADIDANRMNPLALV